MPTTEACGRWAAPNAKEIEDEMSKREKNSTSRLLSSRQEGITFKDEDVAQTRECSAETQHINLLGFHLLAFRCDSCTRLLDMEAQILKHEDHTASLNANKKRKKKQ